MFHVSANNECSPQTFYAKQFPLFFTFASKKCIHFISPPSIFFQILKNLFGRSINHVAAIVPSSEKWFRTQSTECYIILTRRRRDRESESSKKTAGRERFKVSLGERKIEVATFSCPFLRATMEHATPGNTIYVSRNPVSWIILPFHEKVDHLSCDVHPIPLSLSCFSSSFFLIFRESHSRESIAR